MFRSMVAAAVVTDTAAVVVADMVMVEELQQ